jgi:hypothetical protein
MSGVKVYNGKILATANGIAAHDDCCCGCPYCSGQSHRYYMMSFYGIQDCNENSNCDDLNDTTRIVEMTIFWPQAYLCRWVEDGVVPPYYRGGQISVDGDVSPPAIWLSGSDNGRNPCFGTNFFYDWDCNEDLFGVPNEIVCLYDEVRGHGGYVDVELI